MKEVITIEKKIYVIRGERVMLDSDIAELYGVETKRLNEQVRRNISRFPEDFLFTLTPSEYAVLKSQIATSKTGRGGKQKQPLVFTENGVTMLSSVLSSERAIQVNITIMRTFTTLRSYLSLDSKQSSEFEEETNHLFKLVFKKLDGIEKILKPRLDPERKRIGFNSKKES